MACHCFRRTPRVEFSRVTSTPDTYSITRAISIRNNLSGSVSHSIPTHSTDFFFFFFFLAWPHWLFVDLVRAKASSWHWLLHRLMSWVLTIMTFHHFRHTPRVGFNKVTSTPMSYHPTYHLGLWEVFKPSKNFISTKFFRISSLDGHQNRTDFWLGWTDFFGTQKSLWCQMSPKKSMPHTWTVFLELCRLFEKFSETLRGGVHQPGVCVIYEEK